MGRMRFCLLLMLTVLSVAGVAFAQEEKPAEADKVETEHTVYVPYKDLEKVFEKTGRGVFMPYEEFLKLWKKAKEADKARTEPTVPALITGASYTCVIGEETVSVKSTFAIDVLRKGWVELPVALSGVALQEVKLDGEKALLQARKNDYLLILKEKGSHTLEAKFTVKLSKKPDKRLVTFKVPRTPVSRFEITIPEPDVEVEIEPKLLATKTVTPDGQKTQVLAFVGSTDTISVIYKPKPKEALPLAGLFFATVSTHVSFAERLITAQSQIEYEILQNLNRLKVKLPAGWRLLSVNGADIKDWQIEASGAERVLRVDLFTEVKKSYTLSLRVEKELEKSAGIFEAPALAVVGAARESGYVALGAAEGLRIKEKETQNVSQVDQSELPASARRGKVDLSFRYLRHPYKLTIELSEVKPKIALRNDSLVTVTPQFVTLSSALRYTVEKRGIFSVKIELPKGYAVLRAGDPSFVKDYRVKEGDKSQILEVDFKARLIGSFILNLLIQGTRSGEEEPVDLPVAHDPAAQKESGFIGICVRTNLKVITQKSSGLTPIDVGEFAAKVGNVRPERESPLQLAYQFFRYPVSARFKVQKQKPKVVATVETHLSFEEDLVKVQTGIRYTILYAGIRTFRFSIANKVGETAHVSGHGIKEKKFKTEDGVTTWEVQLQGDTLGEYLLNVSYDMKIAPTSQEAISVKIPETTVLDTFEENGYFALCKNETLIVSTQKSTGLELIDMKELPESLVQVSPYESYKYIAHPYSLDFSILKQEFEKVLSTIVSHMHVETEVSKELVATTKMICQVQSKTRQFLTFVVPPQSDVFKLYVNRKEAKRSVGATPQHVMINLSESAPGKTKFYVEIVYKTRLGQNAEMSWCGGLEAIAPTVEGDVPVSRLSARLYLPEQFKYTGFGGNMRRIKARGEEDSLWFWGKSLLFAPPREAASDHELLREIDDICAILAKGGDMITVKLTGEGKQFIFVKQGSGAHVSATYFSENFFYCLDILVLLATVAGLLVFARFAGLPKTALSIFAILLSLILATLASGTSREFLNTAFFGSIITSVFWLVMYVIALIQQGRREATGVRPEGTKNKTLKPQDSGLKPPGPQGPEKGGDS